MKTFTIDGDNNITFHQKFDKEAIPNPGVLVFETMTDLYNLAGDWTTMRLVDIWNSIPGVKPVKKFASRLIGVKRIWEAIESLKVVETKRQKEETKAAAKVAKKAVGETKAKNVKTLRTTKPKASSAKTGEAAVVEMKPIREGSKMATLITLLRRPEGVTLEEAMKVAEWQSHTTRAFMAATLPKRLGVKVISESVDGKRTFRLPAETAQVA